MFIGHALIKNKNRADLLLSDAESDHVVPDDNRLIAAGDIGLKPFAENGFEWPTLRPPESPLTGWILYL
jgi:hypothetical protein